MVGYQMSQMPQDARDKNWVLPDQKGQGKARERVLPPVEDQKEASPILPDVQKIVVEYVV